MPSPENKQRGAMGVPIRLVIITLDHHIALAVEVARAQLREELPGLQLSLHAATSFRDADALRACERDVAGADIVFANMLFVDEHIEAIRPALEARRDECDAMVCAMSAGSIMRLTRMGDFRMDRPAKGPLALLKKLRGSREGAKDGGAGQLAMLRRIPKLLRFIPGKAQDLRCYLLSLAYWTSGSADNIADLVRTLVNRYATGERAALRGTLRPAPPREYPDTGVYHPDLPHRISSDVSDLPARDGALGTVGLIIMRSYVLSGDSGHYDAVIRRLEGRGLRVIPAFASGLDARPAIEAFFLDRGRVTVDAVVSLTGFSLVGGPAFNDAKAAEEMLARLDVPYIGAQALEFQTIEQWHQSTAGLMPIEATIMVAIPELDGAIAPTVFGGRSTADVGGRGAKMIGIDDRVDTLARRVERLVRLRKKSASERNVAIVLFNFPPNGGATGTAAYLSVFESLHKTLSALAVDGYEVDVPPSVADLRDRILGGNINRYGTDANVAAFVSVDDYVRREPHLREIEEQWGPAPGKLQTDGKSLFVLGARFGRVLVAVQPGFGFEGDPMRLLHAKGFAPTHAFAAFYGYLRWTFDADVVLHFGTHGALEFMPGKQVGMSDKCWPERLIGDVPNVYLYASNNPSEGALARRRSAATLVSHLTPPVVKSGLYRDLVSLKERVQQLRIGELTDRCALDEAQEQAVALELCSAEPAWTSASDPAIGALWAAIIELEETLIPCGLHVIGGGMPEAARREVLRALAMNGPNPLAEPDSEAVMSAEEADALIDRVVAGDDAKRALRGAGLRRSRARQALAAELVRVERSLSEDHETPAVIRALSGRYIRPAPGGDVLRNPAVLPTGRNVHGFDPFALPTAHALRRGAEQAELLLNRHQALGNELPSCVAIVLWGSDNLKSGGEPIGQALALLGARPRFDSYGRLCGAELIPITELGRPRIDVLITLSGIFRDLLPLQTRVLAEAAHLAGAADEPVDMNHVRRHALAYQERLGCSTDQSTLRVFSNAEGAYGANVNQLIDGGTWQDEDELADAYEKRKCFAYDRVGGSAPRPALLKAVLADVEVTYQNLESVELGVTTIDHYFDTLGGLGRAAKRAGGRAASIPVYLGDQTQGDAVVRTLSEQVALESRTRSLNPRWTDEMLKHGAEGVRQIEAHVTNTLGWSATTGQVEPWVYRELTKTYVLDEAMRQRLAELNPRASLKLASRLLEASERNYWAPDAEMLAALEQAGDELEDKLEGITEQVA